ncbi:MAG TPA: anthranilate phosphoribosyltransferase [Thermoleophilaceae bacterium]|nr:anthranilate phosphoribosyltransferase [Thermoleophilaceae bacterium]
MANDVVTPAIDRVASGHDLSAEEAAAVLREIMEGRVTEVQTAAFLIALRTKGETVDEVAGLASTMRALATRVELGRDDVVDTAGTGGGAPSFNVSTTAALLAAAAGATIAKHGNRSATGRCGSADVLEALGARIDLEPPAIAECIAEVGFGFMFAPMHHQATRYVIPVRRDLAVRTIFNLLGPLTNPAGAKRQVIGVSDPAYLETMAGALARLGSESALIVSSEDGLDELSVSAPTHVVELRGGEIDSFTLTPEEAGLERASADSLAQGGPAENAELTRAVLTGKLDGVERALVVLNAGAALYVGAAAGSIQAGVREAEEAITTGAAAELLERYVAKTKELAPA